MEESVYKNWESMRVLIDFAGDLECQVLVQLQRYHYAPDTCSASASMTELRRELIYKTCQIQYDSDTESFLTA